MAHTDDQTEPGNTEPPGHDGPSPRAAAASPATPNEEEAAKQPPTEDPLTADGFSGTATRTSDDDTFNPNKDFAAPDSSVYMPTLPALLGSIRINLAPAANGYPGIFRNESVCAINSADMRLVCAWLLQQGVSNLTVFDLTRRQNGSSYGAETPAVTLPHLLKQAESGLVIFWLGSIAGRSADLKSIFRRPIRDFVAAGQKVILASHAWSDDARKLLEADAVHCIDPPADEIITTLCCKGEYFARDDAPELISQLGRQAWADTPVSSIREFLDLYCTNEAECREYFLEARADTLSGNAPKEYIDQLDALVTSPTPIDCASLYLLDAFGEMPLPAFEALSETLAEAIADAPEKDQPRPETRLSDAVLRRCRIRTAVQDDGRQWAKLRLRWNHFVAGHFRSRLPHVLRRLEAALIEKMPPLITGQSFSDGLARIVASRMVGDGLIGTAAGENLMAHLLFSGQTSDDEPDRQLEFILRLSEELEKLRGETGVTGLQSLLLGLAIRNNGRGLEDTHHRQLWWLLWGLTLSGSQDAARILVPGTFAAAGRMPARALDALDKVRAPQLEDLPGLMTLIGSPFCDERSPENRKEFHIRVHIFDLLAFNWLSRSVTADMTTLETDAGQDRVVRSALRQVLVYRLLDAFRQPDALTAATEFAELERWPDRQVAIWEHIRSRLFQALWLSLSGYYFQGLRHEFAKARLNGLAGATLLSHGSAALVRLGLERGELLRFADRCRSFGQLPALLILAGLHERSEDGALLRDDTIAKTLRERIGEARASLILREAISAVADDLSWLRDAAEDLSSADRDTRRQLSVYLRALRQKIKMLPPALRSETAG